MAKKAATTLDFFGGATEAKSGSKGRTKDVKDVAILGLRDLKACRRLRGVILAVETEIETNVKEAMIEHFVAEGCEQGRQPANFNGVDRTDDGAQSANCQLKLRSYGPNGMSDEAVEEVEAAGLGDLIETKKTFQFNEDALTDDVMATINEALSAVAHRLPAGLLKVGVRRKLKTESIDRLFNRHAAEPAFVQSNLPLLSTLAVRCNYDLSDENIAPDVERVAALLAKPELTDIIHSAAADPEPSPARKRTKKAA